MRGYVVDNYLGVGLFWGFGREVVDFIGVFRFCGDCDLGWLFILFIDLDIVCVKVEYFIIIVIFKCF